MARDARIFCEVLIASAVGTGKRVVASEDGELFHVFHCDDIAGEYSPQQTFNLSGARETARMVLAGDPLVSTSPGTLRILAAAVLIKETRPDPVPSSAELSDEGAGQREEEGRAD